MHGSQLSYSKGLESGVSVELLKQEAEMRITRSGADETYPR